MSFFTPPGATPVFAKRRNGESLATPWVEFGPRGIAAQQLIGPILTMHTATLLPSQLFESKQLSCDHIMM